MELYRMKNEIHLQANSAQSIGDRIRCKHPNSQ